jgi:hypothetical protein
MLVCNVQFPSDTVIISKGNAYDGNNNLIRSIYQVIIIGDFWFGMEGECQKVQD